MSDIKKQEPIFPSAAEDSQSAKLSREQGVSHRLAYNDFDFLHRDELTAVRLELEWLKPDMIQTEQGIQSTVVIFGSARFNDPDTAREKLERAKQALDTDPGDASLIKQLAVAERALENSRFYEETRELARRITRTSLALDGNHFVVVTGGGPGLMEAANRGAADVGGKSLGLNIVLPFEQIPNDYITPELCFQFHYFAIRKMHFLKRARALVACPGGFGTLDELFDALTLLQTRKIKPLPIILMGSEYWRKLINFEFLVEQGAIEEKDLKLFHLVDSADEACCLLREHWGVEQVCDNDGV